MITNPLYGIPPIYYIIVIIIIINNMAYLPANDPGVWPCARASSRASFAP